MYIFFLKFTYFTFVLYLNTDTAIFKARDADTQIQVIQVQGVMLHTLQAGKLHLVKVKNYVTLFI